MEELRAEGLCKRFLRGKREVKVLQDASLCLGRGELAFLTGESGSGKTTLLKMLAGLLKPDGGRVLVNGRDSAALTEDERCDLRQRVVSYLPQQLGLLEALTAVQNVALPAMFSGDKAQCKELYSRATALLDRTGALALRDACPAELSGGETKRVLLARALMTAPRFLLADEPTADLDRESAADFLRLFAALRAQGTGVLVVTHDWSQLRAADRVLQLRDGTVRDVTEEIGTSG